MSEKLNISQNKNKPASPDAPSDPSRRKFMKVAGVNAVGLGAMYLTSKYAPTALEENIPPQAVVEEEKVEQESLTQPESVETIEQSDKMRALVSRYQAQVRITSEQISVTLLDNTPIGDPIDFVTFQIPYQTKNEKGELVTRYNPLGPGKVYEEGPLKGHLSGGIAGGWIEHALTKFATEHDIPRESIQSDNIEPDIDAALHNPREPELRKAILEGKCKSIIDIVRYFGDTPVSKTDQRSRLQYLNDELRFDETGRNLPEITQQHLKFFFMGLVAKESKYDMGVTKNSDTACSALQITDLVRVGYGYAKDADLTFEQQVEVAGKMMADSYTQFFGHVQNKNEGGMATIRKCFSSEENFQKFFVVPCLLNSYNCGVGLMGRAVRAFEIEVLAKLDSQTVYDGYDLFLKLAEFSEGKSFGTDATYGPDAREYVPYSFAYAIELHASLNADVES